ASPNPGQRRGRRHPCRARPAGVRAALHDQGGRARHRPRPLHRAASDAAQWRRSAAGAGRRSAPAALGEHRIRDLDGGGLMALRSKTRTALETVALVAALLGGAWMLFRGTLYRPANAVAAAQAADEPRADEAIVVAVAGDAVRLSPGGGTSALAVGQRLRADDSVRTGRGGRTDLQMGTRSRLTVSESTQLTVREITEKLHRFKLTRGRIAVDYQADGARLLRIESADGGAVAETQGARFGVLSTGTAVA